MSSYPLILAILANVIWGTTFWASKELVRSWGPITATFLRFLVAVVFMVLVSAVFKKKIHLPKGREQLTWVFLTGLFGFGLLFPLQVMALQWIPTALSACLMLTTPLFLTFIVFSLGGSIGLNKWVGVLLGMIGGLILLAPNAMLADFASDFWVGIALTLASSFLLAASTFTSQKALASMDRLSVTFWGIAVGMILLAPMALLEAPKEQVISMADILYLLYLGIVCSVLAFLMWNYSLTRISSQGVASTMHLKTPVAVLLGALLGGEILGGPFYVGAPLIMLGVLCSQFEKHPFEFFRRTHD